MLFKLYRDHACGDEFCDDVWHLDDYPSLEDAQAAAQAKVGADPLVWKASQDDRWSAIIDRYDFYFIIQTGGTP